MFFITLCHLSPTPRTRYISTELGIRQKLLVAVLTSQATLPTLGVAVNRTLGHRLERVVFLTGSRGRRAPPGMAVVTLGEERPIGHLHLALRHLLEQHGDDFDWFFLVPDATYTEAHGLARLVGRLSLAAAAHLYLGRPQDFIGGEPAPGRYCHGGFGVLLSRTLLQQLRPHLEACRNDIVSARPDEWLGRCILDATGVGCTGDHEVRRDASPLVPPIWACAHPPEKQREWLEIQAWVSLQFCHFLSL